MEVLHASTCAAAPKLLKSADASATEIDINCLRLQPNPREVLHIKSQSKYLQSCWSRVSLFVEGDWPVSRNHVENTVTASR